MCIFSCSLLLVLCRGPLLHIRYTTLTSITNTAFTPCVCIPLALLPSISCSAVWNAIRIHVSAGPLCLLTESKTIFYTGEHEHEHAQRVLCTYDIIKWCYSLGCKIIAAQEHFQREGFTSILRCVFCFTLTHKHTLALSHSTWYNIQSLNSMHICREKNECVYIVYYQQFWFYIEWLVVRVWREVCCEPQK